MKISTVGGVPRARVIFLALLACVTALATPAAETNKEKQQKQIRDMAQDTLQRLYKAEPKTEAAVKHAFGYAVFSDLGVKILFAGTGSGKGIAVNNRDKHEIFMKMLEAQAGNELNGTKEMELIRGYSWTSPRGKITLDLTTREPVEDYVIRQVQQTTAGYRNVVIDTIPQVNPATFGAGG